MQETGLILFTVVLFLLYPIGMALRQDDIERRYGFKFPT